MKYMIAEYSVSAVYRKAKIMLSYDESVERKR